jgi:hypothetical protein
LFSDGGVDRVAMKEFSSISLKNFQKLASFPMAAGQKPPLAQGKPPADGTEREHKKRTLKTHSTHRGGGKSSGKMKMFSNPALRRLRRRSI